MKHGADYPLCKEAFVNVGYVSTRKLVFSPGIALLPMSIMAKLSSFQQPRAPFAQSVREEPEEDEPDPDDVFNDDLGMEDGVQTTEDEIQTGDDEDAEVDDPSEARGGAPICC